MDHQGISERVRDIATGVAKDSGLEFVHSEIAGTKRNMIVRVFIDKPGGITIEDCSDASRKIEAVLDADDFIPAAYVLEVSSPGLDRGLYSLEDFQRFTGKAAKVKTEFPIAGQRNFNGTIAAVDDGEIVFDDRVNGTVRFPFSAVAKANLKIDLHEELKGR